MDEHLTFTSTLLINLTHGTQRCPSRAALTGGIRAAVHVSSYQLLMFTNNCVQVSKLIE